MTGCPARGLLRWAMQIFLSKIGLSNQIFTLSDIIRDIQFDSLMTFNFQINKKGAPPAPFQASYLDTTNIWGFSLTNSERPMPKGDDISFLPAPGNLRSSISLFALAITTGSRQPAAAFNYMANLINTGNYLQRVNYAMDMVPPLSRTKNTVI